MSSRGSGKSSGGRARSQNSVQERDSEPPGEQSPISTDPGLVDKGPEGECQGLAVPRASPELHLRAFVDFWESVQKAGNRPGWDGGSISASGELAGHQAWANGG